MKVSKTVRTACERIIGMMIKKFSVNKVKPAWTEVVKLMWVWITPAMAEAMLTRNFSRNRKLNERNLSCMLKELSGGTWYPSVSTIVFTLKGWLIDGQHRLETIVASGKPMLCLVALNVPEDAVFGIDTNLPRNTGVSGKIAGVINDEKTCPIARRMMQSVTPNYYAPGRTEHLQYARKYEKFAEQAIDWFRNSPKGVNCVSAKAVVARALAKGNPAKKLERFVTVLKYGVGVKDFKAHERGIVLLHDLMCQDNGARSGHKSYQLYNKIETILHGYLTGKPVKRLLEHTQHVASIVPTARELFRLRDDIKGNTACEIVVATTPGRTVIVGDVKEEIGSLFKPARNKRLAIILPMFRQGMSTAKIAKHIRVSVHTVRRDLAAARKVGLIPGEDGEQPMFRVAAGGGGN